MEWADGCSHRSAPTPVLCALKSAVAPGQNLVAWARGENKKKRVFLRRDHDCCGQAPNRGRFLDDGVMGSLGGRELLGFRGFADPFAIKPGLLVVLMLAEK